jgi:TetR/AcrR family transcriptional regulator, cholesterol catabolism regulator
VSRRAATSPARPRRRPGQEVDGGRRQQLLRASARLFREQGFDGTSVRDIARAAGMQSGSWVYHFPTKQDILVAVMEEGLLDALARIESIAAQGLDPREQFAQLVRTHLDTILGPGQDFVPVLLYEWRSLESPARRRVSVPLKRYEAIWQAAIDALQQSGAWTGATRIDALLLFGALNWIARWYRPGGPLDVDALAAECVRFFLRTPSARRKTARAAG